MGSERFYPEERPVARVTVDDLWVDEHPVTNEQFATFVGETGHVTVPERAPTQDDFPGADPELLVPGSQVFTPTRGPVPLDDWTRWWRWQPGADWRHPTGPGSGIDDRAGPPRRARWLGGRGGVRPLGRQAAADGGGVGACRPRGLDGATYPWGDEFCPDGRLHGEHVGRTVPVRESAPARVPRHVTGPQLPAQRVRPLRRRRQRLGVDEQPLDGAAGATDRALDHAGL